MTKTMSLLEAQKLVDRVFSMLQENKHLPSEQQKADVDPRKEKLANALVGQEIDGPIVQTFEDILALHDNRSIDDLHIMLMKHNDYVGSLIWTRNDIAEELANLGFVDSEKNIDEVLNVGAWELKGLNDTTDQDWYCIDNAIHEASEQGVLEKI